MWLVTVAIAFVIAVFGQYLLRRTRLVGNPLLAFLVSGTLLGLWLMAVLYYSDTSTSMTAATLFYAFLCEFYIFLFSFAYSSISANLLVRLQGRALEREVIDQLYDSDGMVTRRVEGLIEVGLLANENGTIIPTSKGKKVAAIFTAVRGFFGHK